MRTLVRLKHTLPADEEIHAVLPETLEEFDAALARDELKAKLDYLSTAEAIRKERSAAAPHRRDSCSRQR